MAVKYYSLEKLPLIELCKILAVLLHFFPELYASGIVLQPTSYGQYLGQEILEKENGEYRLV